MWDQRWWSRDGVTHWSSWELTRHWTRLICSSQWEGQGSSISCRAFSCPQWVVITLEHSSSSEKVEQRAEWWLAQVVMIGMQQQLLQLLLIISRVSWQVLLDFYCPEIFRNKPGLISYEQNIYKLPHHYTSPGGHCLSSRLLSRLVQALWNKINPPQNMTTAVHCSNGLKSPAWPLRCSSFTLWLFEGQQIVDFLRSDKRRLQILLQCPPTYQNLRNL